MWGCGCHGVNSIAVMSSFTGSLADAGGPVNLQSDLGQTGPESGVPAAAGKVGLHLTTSQTLHFPAGFASAAARPSGSVVPLVVWAETGGGGQGSAGRGGVPAPLLPPAAAAPPPGHLDGPHGPGAAADSLDAPDPPPAAPQSSPRLTHDSSHCSDPGSPYAPPLASPSEHPSSVSGYPDGCSALPLSGVEPHQTHSRSCSVEPWTRLRRTWKSRGTGLMSRPSPEGSQTHTWTCSAIGDGFTPGPACSLLVWFGSITDLILSFFPPSYSHYTFYYWTKLCKQKHMWWTALALDPKVRAQSQPETCVLMKINIEVLCTVLVF